ncbi:MAG: hypothetical protein ABW166_10590 [Sedimenticola sp.]
MNFTCSAVPLENYNFETLEHLRNNMPKWIAEVQQKSCRGRRNCKEPKLYFIELHLNEITDPLVRAKRTL